MKIFGSFTSPFVRHCRIVMQQEGFQFTLIETDYDQSALGSPTSKVPYFTDGEVALTDSTSIVKYVREKAGKAFIASATEMDGYALANTVLDSAINLFLLEKDGITPDKSAYLKRQSARVTKGLAELNELVAGNTNLHSDFVLRVACLLDWGRYRGRFEFSEFDNLTALLAQANQNELFAETTPP